MALGYINQFAFDTLGKIGNVLLVTLMLTQLIDYTSAYVRSRIQSSIRSGSARPQLA